MTSRGEYIDGPVSGIPLTSAQLGTLAAAEFSMYFQDLPTFEPNIPHARPVIDTHVGTWVEHPDHRDGYALLWRTRAQRVVPEYHQIDGTFIKVSRDPSDCRVEGKPKQFEVYSNVATPVSGERLAHKFDDDELLLIQNIVRKTQKHRRRTEVVMDKFVVSALIGGITQPPRRKRRSNRRR